MPTQCKQKSRITTLRDELAAGSTGPETSCVARIRWRPLLKLWILIVISLGTRAWGEQEFDIVVYGATPGGIGAAIAAARMGRTVALIVPQNHVGGMTASGLSG